jgi:antitoxin (DNA-binding transcriptional repressor) of toxin-antitoxin stability system
MKTVGALDAETYLNALLKRVSQGETIRIALRGVPIAMLVPSHDREEIDPGQLVRDIRELRKGARLRKTSIRKLIGKSRRC